MVGRTKNEMKPHYIRAINSHINFIKYSMIHGWNRDVAAVTAVTVSATVSKCAHEHAHTPIHKHTKKCLVLASNPIKKVEKNRNKNDMCAMK